MTTTALNLRVLRVVWGFRRFGVLKFRVLGLGVQGSSERVSITIISGKHGDRHHNILNPEP